MAELLVLNLGSGDWQKGCPMVVAQLWRSDGFAPMQFTGSLPALPQLGTLYAHWQQLYTALYAYKGWRNPSFDIEIDEDDITHISEGEFHQICQDLHQCLNTWLTAPSFLPLERQLRTQLNPANDIRCIITAENRQLLRLPWFQWQFFEDYPKAELALSLPDYTRSVKTVAPTSRSRVKILAILGDSRGIQVNRDRQLLEQLPNTDLHFLVEPDRDALNQQLWEPGWDILFFAGHSSSGEHGQIQINPTDSLTLEQLRYGLKQAIAGGLRLAVFNSCDGLGLAWDLADLHIPQVIVMREPVPDRVAQEFLKHFLIAFSAGESLYLAVRQARERLQGLESEFPCATWLPVICQNPAELPQTWQEWQGEAPKQPVRSTSRLFPRKVSTGRAPRWQNLVQTVLTSTITTALVIGVRSLGLLQPLELAAFDQLLRLRPTEPPDSRFLIVTISEADIQRQDSEQRRGSLSDQALNQLLETLERYEASVIGLDVYRDFSVSSDEPGLAERLRRDRLVAICKSSNPVDDPTGTAPPPEVVPDQVGFSDFLEDADGVLRRHLVVMTPDPDSPCTTPYAFNARLAFLYLQQSGITPQFTPEGNLQLGETVFPRLVDPAGGYQTLDERGSQLLLNYRSLSSPGAIAPQVSLTDVLSGQVNPDAIRDRIVLIGVTAPGTGDYWLTPYGSGPTQRVPGVMLQAQMTSQLISAVLDKRPILTTWAWWQDGLWILAWAGVGGSLIIYGRLSRWRKHLASPLAQLIAGGVALGVLTALSLMLLVQGVWVPLVPGAIAVVLTGAVTHYLKPKA
ncbi:CHASE2 domain-containing protein [Oscillatoria sp. FACHB-1407]|uniref:CHASE2 domain-containing protein n=1 Tax=Oscillatoria sp. FACHB-1407 TaxID=2692847 RepID=UPI0016853615|nr:CHASE2 domain-containing protein [Oscillatoria sp. FACHB-1407]MBD2461149.1 CHASE2 domain-containing protein [Oscillatoria sp. FACHB-1407]